MLRFACPRCKSIMEVSDADGGAKIACLSCGQRLQVPMPPLSKTVLAPLVSHPPAAAIRLIPPAVIQPAPVMKPQPIAPVGSAQVLAPVDDVVVLEVDKPMVRCWRCGQFFPVRQTVRRNLGGGCPALLAILLVACLSLPLAILLAILEGSASRDSRVDLCPACNWAAKLRLAVLLTLLAVAVTFTTVVWLNASR
jgi:hypothetical protein